jgi:hypothetical protein
VTLTRVLPLETSTSLKVGDVPKNVGCVSVRVRIERATRVVPIFTIMALCSRVQYRAFVSTLPVLFATVMERIFFHCVDGKFEIPHKPAAGAVRAILSPATTYFQRTAWNSHPVPYGQFAVTYYTGVRLRNYAHAEMEVILGNSKDSDSYLATFGKLEKIKANLCWPSPTLMKRLINRAIQPRHIRYNVRVGRYLRPLEFPIYSLLERMFGSCGKVVMKGLNSVEVATCMRASWNRFTNPVAVGLDANRFDQHVNEALLQWEHSIYTKFYSGTDRDELMHLLSLQLYNRGFVRAPQGTIKYSVHGGRCSGDMNTALGNCLIMCSVLYCHTLQCGLKATDVALINNGDDCVLVCESRHLTQLTSTLPQFMERVGLSIRVEQPTRVFEQIEFCQAHPVHDGVGYRMVRNVPDVLSKDATILRQVDHPDVYPRYLMALGQCGSALSSGIPIMQEYYACMMRQARGPALNVLYGTGMYQMAKGMVAEYRSVTMHSRYSFYLAFGILPDLQVEFEARLAQLDLAYVAQGGMVPPLF